MTRYLPTAYPNGPATYPMGLVAAGNTCHFPLSSKGERVSEIPGEPTRDVVRWVQTQVKRRERSWGFAKCTMVFYHLPASNGSLQHHKHLKHSPCSASAIFRCLQLVCHRSWRSMESFSWSLVRVKSNIHVSHVHAPPRLQWERCSVQDVTGAPGSVRVAPSVAAARMCHISFYT